MTVDAATSLPRSNAPTYGEALYNGIPEVVEDPGRAEKWRILTELEVVTKAFCDPNWLESSTCRSTRYAN
ncbi:hypothetical protein [Hyphomicrobium sp.]|uniref:hypothetical protein n=1 Tax=Hyphomicrobium sp. TaxID=82 RepID=UPI002D783084|nr:hypothetical protein [Hyphomicrobium sp.]HET6390725.1 hypothetical protein [Hyphomicrobium sp.]